MPNPILMRKLRGGGGGPFIPADLEGWDYIHETYVDYPIIAEGDLGNGSQLIGGQGWTDTTLVTWTDFAQQMAYDTTDTGFADGVSINSYGGGEGWEGPWVVG